LFIVIDASSVVAAALKAEGIPRRALLLARERHTIALSEPVFAEIAEVLRRSKFAAVLTTDGRLEVLELLSAAAVWFEPKMPVSDCRDAKDNKYLELALAAGAAFIVSSDTDLLVLDPWRDIRIIRPAELLAKEGSAN
jgi:putative PIN family toxin of toxin-antitoxin system